MEVFSFYYILKYDFEHLSWLNIEILETDRDFDHPTLLSQKKDCEACCEKIH